MQANLGFGWSAIESLGNWVSDINMYKIVKKIDLILIINTTF